MALWMCPYMHTPSITFQHTPQSQMPLSIDQDTHPCLALYDSAP